MAQERRKRQTVQFTFARKSEVYRAETQEELDQLGEAFGKTLLREGEYLLHVQGGAEFHIVEVPDPPPPPAPVLPTLEETLAVAEAQLADFREAEAAAAALTQAVQQQYATLLAVGTHRDEVARLFDVSPLVVVAVQKRIDAERAQAAAEAAAQARKRPRPDPLTTDPPVSPTA